MHWKVANYSHRNLTLADWLQPRSRQFCTWNGARCYFWERDLMEEPQREWQEQNADSEPNPPHTPPPSRSLCPPSISSSHFSDYTNPCLSDLTQRIWHQQNNAKHKIKDLCKRIALIRVLLTDIKLMLARKRGTVWMTWSREILALWSSEQRSNSMIFLA